MPPLLPAPRRPSDAAFGMHDSLDACTRNRPENVVNTALGDRAELQSSGRAGGVGRAPSHHRASRIWPAAAAMVTYAAVALAANWPTWPGDPNRMRAGDRDQMAWFLAWTPYALLHLHNIFYTTWLNYPAGVNLAQNTSSPLLGLLAAPVTLLVNPIASVNLLCWLAFPISAGSMYFVLRRWVRWNAAAFVGGALYGFSPYVVAQASDHINLAFVPLPPLIALAAFECVRARRAGSRRWGTALGCLVVAQFFISPEIAATTVLIVILAAVVLALSRPSQVKTSLHHGITALALACVIVGVSVGYPIWAMVAGPYRYQGPAYAGGVSADLLGTLAPTSLQRFAPSGLSAAGSRLLFGNLTENGSYIGLPLTVILVVLMVLCWRHRWIRFTALMAVITVVLSYGPHLVVGNRQTGIPLPWDVLQHFPFANNIITVRLALYTWLFVAVLVALGMDALHDRWRRTPSLRATRPRPGPARVAGACLLGGLALISALSLVPAWPIPTAPAAVPPYFSDPVVDRIAPGSVALISPYPSVAETQPQLWQAVAGMRFRIIGGYGLFAGPKGTSTNFPDVLLPEDVQRFLWTRATGGAPYPSGRTPTLSGHLICQFRGFLARYDVDTVISSTALADPAALDALFSNALGRPSTNGAGVSAWYGVQADLLRHGPICRS